MYYEYDMIHIRSDTNGGMPVMFTQVVVISRLYALLAEYDQRSFLNPFYHQHTNGQASLATESKHIAQ